MESTNAIVRTKSGTPGRLYDYNEYGVKQANCVPPPVAPFEYEDMELIDLNGQSLAPSTVQDLGSAQNVMRYIKVEL